MIGSMIMCVGDERRGKLHTGARARAPQSGRRRVVIPFGLYYRLIPAAGTSTLAKVQGWLHIIGAIAFPIGVAIVIVKGEALVAIPIVGSLIVTAAMALFAVIVFRTAHP